MSKSDASQKRATKARSSSRGHRSSSVYRHDGDNYLVELKLREARQLFNSLDPAPFREKDLDNAAEEYIVSAVRELGLRRAMRLIVHLPSDALNGENEESIESAIRHYFDYRAHHAADDLRQTLVRGALNFAIGLAFLAICLSVRLVVAQSASPVVIEGLLIIGWVAMWRPLETFLYDWWPLQHRQRIFRRICTMPITVDTSTRASGQQQSK